jgi:phage shock protein C
MSPNTINPKKLYRSRTDCKIAGVCGGLGAYFDIDPTLVRLFFILFFFVGGSAFLAYVVIWIITPLEPIGQG